MTDSLSDLIHRAQSGDRAAWDELYALYMSQIQAHLRRKLGGKLRRKVDSEELLQSVFVEIFEDIDQFNYQGPSSFLHWVCRLTENKIRDKGRFFHAARRDVDREISLNDAIPSSQDAPPHPPEGIVTSPSEHLLRQEEEDLWKRAFDALEPRYQEVLRMHKIEGLSTQEIAERMGRSRRMVQILLAEAMIQLNAIRKRFSSGQG
jgi:RNA polymerase sigma-70 factor (ECF subfamily)